MFDKPVFENYIYIPYKKKSNSDRLSDLNRRLNSKGTITSIRTSSTRNLTARMVFNNRGGHTQYGEKILDSQAEMFSDGLPVTLSFFRTCWIDPGCPGFSAKYWLEEFPSHAVLRYFSGADEKDITFIRRCLKQTRFKRD
tara:strand:- start:14 stop:433 length:420 start_codon:yes stop_codon:yes gene_type:complete